MSSAASSPLPVATLLDSPLEKPNRIVSVDALRGFVMLTMIFVNDLDEEKSPWWMQHFHGPNGMTFVDLVFPAFIFIVGMAIPLAFLSRLNRGESIWKLMGHVVLRTVCLLAIGILMVNAESGASKSMMPRTAYWWEGLMFLFAILAFADIGPRKKDRRLQIINWSVRGVSAAVLIWLAIIYRGGRHGTPIIQFSPFMIHTSWYGILGLIGWSYLVASIVFALFRTRRLPILTAVALLYCLFALDKNGAFDGMHWLHFINVGEMLGTHPAIAVGGLLLGTVLLTPDTVSHSARLRFSLWAALGFGVVALVVHPPLASLKTNPPLWGVSKNAATPAWGLWACCATSLLWVLFYLVADVWQWNWLARPWAIAGQNVLLAYLISEGLESWLKWVHLSNWYDNLAEPNLTHAICRSLGCGVVILCLTALLNRIGFWVRL